jgi:hypothetical protein
MPARRHFFRSPSPIDQRQGTIYNRLSWQLPRPGPRPLPAEERRQEPTGTRNMVGGVNEAVVLEMFRAFRSQYREDLDLIGDDDNLELHRRCAYTREHKLRAIDYAITTWERHPRTGGLGHISQYYAAKRLKISRNTLHRWIKSKQKILRQKKGSRRLRLSKVGHEPEMEKKLNLEFEAAREIGRQISHRWFTR